MVLPGFDTGRPGEDFIQFAERLAQRVSGGQGRLNSGDPEAIPKLFSHVDQKATEFEQATGTPKQSTFQQMVSTLGASTGSGQPPAPPSQPVPQNLPAADQENIRLLQKAAELGVKTFPGFASARNVEEANQAIRDAIAKQQGLLEFPEALAARDARTGSPGATALTGLQIAGIAADPLGMAAAEGGAELGRHFGGTPGAIAGGLLGGLAAPLPRLRPSAGRSFNPAGTSINPQFDIPPLVPPAIAGLRAARGAAKEVAGGASQVLREIPTAARRAIDDVSPVGTARAAGPEDVPVPRGPEDALEAEVAAVRRQRQHEELAGRLDQFDDGQLQEILRRPRLSETQRTAIVEEISRRDLLDELPVIDLVSQQIDELNVRIEAEQGRVVRPRWAVGITNQELRAVARQENADPSAIDWSDALDPKVIQEARGRLFRNQNEPGVTQLIAQRRDLRQQLREENARVKNSVALPTAAAVRRSIGPVSDEGVKVTQARISQLRGAAYAESSEARGKLKVLIELFAKPKAHRAAQENMKVFKERLGRGVRNAQGAEARGDFQGAARIQQSAQRGKRITEQTPFGAIARRADPEDQFSDVVQFASPEDVLITTGDIQLLHRQARSHFFLQGKPQSANNAQFALNKLLLGERLQPAEISLLEEALGLGGALRGRSREGVNAFINLLTVPKTLRSAIDKSALLRQAGFYVINAKTLSPSISGAARRKTIRDSIGVMFRAYKGKDRVAREVWDDISRRDPSLWEAVQQRPGGRRLHLYQPDELALSQRDEAFMSTIFSRLAGLNIREGNVPLRIAKLPLKLIGEGVERSEVAFTGLLNRVRYDAVEQLVRDAERAGLDVFSEPGVNGFRSVVAKELMDDIVNWTNITTGRGSLGGTVAGQRISAEGLGTVLNGLFWAPRLATARVETLVRGSSRVVREGARIARTGDVAGRSLLTPGQFAVRKTAEEFVGFLSAGMTILGLGVLAREAGVPGFDAFEAELDPRSSDFGKSRLGDTRFDFWGGHQQYIRSLAQIITGQRKATTTGNIGDADLAEVTFRLARSKLSPGIPAIAVSELSRETFLGENLSAPSSAFGTDRVDDDGLLGFMQQFRDAAIPGGGGGSVRTRDILQQMVPLTIIEYIDLMRDRGLIEGGIMGVAPYFGAGTQTFGEPAATDPPDDDAAVPVSPTGSRLTPVAP